MSFSLSRRAVAGLVFPALPVAAAAQQGSSGAVAATQPASITPELAREIAQEAYIWAYPLVLMDLTRKVTTNFAASTSEFGQAPVNQFSHARAFPLASFRAVVRPNFDTLYSAAWLDLQQQPMVITLPRTDRYHVFQIMDGWSEVFAAPGSRTNGGEGGSTLIAGPNWRGEVPSGMDLIRSPTDIAWVIGRMQTNGAADYGFVHALQDQVTLAPLGQQGRSFTPPRGSVDPAVDMRTPPMVAVDGMGGEAFFTATMEALRKSRPLAHDHSIVARMKRLGLEPGRSLEFGALPEPVQQALKDAPAAGMAVIRKRAANPNPPVNGWNILAGAIGAYGADYTFRASVALTGLGANRPEDAIYPFGNTDGDGNPMNGTHRYTLTFARGQTPPVAAFWSITLYDDKGFPVENALNRQAIGDRDRLTLDSDGSLTLYLQHRSPGADKEANWLPAPEGVFTLAMRCYSPKPPLFSGEWVPPPVRRVTR